MNAMYAYLQTLVNFVNTLAIVNGLYRGLFFTSGAAFARSVRSRGREPNN